jgi:hypothetical protein
MQVLCSMSKSASSTLQPVGVAGDEPAAAAAPQGQLAFAAGGILGWHRRRAAEIDLQVVRDWNAFVSAEPFWLRQQNGAA